MAEELASASVAGLALAARYNPVFAFVVAAVAAALAGYPRAPRYRIAWASVLLAAGWFVGDGLRVLARARDLLDGTQGLLSAGAPTWAQWSVLVLWGLGGLLVGYALPAWAGAFVGRRVTRGTGWLAAIWISVAASAAVASLAGFSLR